MFYVKEQDLYAIAGKLAKVVEERYFETMSPKERNELQAAIIRELREVLGPMQEKVDEETGISY